MYFLISILFILFYLFFNPNLIFAAENKFITIVNPVRGKDFWQQNYQPLENVRRQFIEVNKRNLSATWLLRPDTLFDSDITAFLKEDLKNQEIGLFMEITPTWANLAKVDYRENTNWHSAGSIFLTGYEVEERKKLIESAFGKFKDVFGVYPRSVGAWWIDAGSLNFMKEKYGVVANLDVADQYTTDNYQVWGQYFSQPFYPAKKNALVPASSQEQKIGLVTIQWATRDPYNSFGNGVLDSTYSVQANDYANKKFHNLDINYFKKLISIYLDNPYSNLGQVTIGLENDFSWEEFGSEYQKQLDVISQRRSQGIQVTTMSGFANHYFQLYPNISPEVIIFSSDLLGSDGAVMWYQNSRYRVGWFFHNNQSVIRDLRLYFDSREEECLTKSCSQLNLAMQETKNLDEVSFGNRWVIDEGRIKDIRIKPTSKGVVLTYTNQAKVNRELEFLPNDIKLDGASRPISVVIAEAADSYVNTEKISHSFTFHLHDDIREVLINQFKIILIFFGFILIFFYLPGVVILKDTNLTNNQKIILSIVTGLVIFTLTSYLFGYLKFYWGVLIIPLLSLILTKGKFILPVISWKKNLFLASGLIIIGLISLLLTSIKNGLIYDYGMGFWGANGHDAIWHLGLAAALKNGLPPSNPAFAGEVLKNYHYFYDLLLASSSFITQISVVDLYFRCFPIFITTLMGLLAYLLSKQWFKSDLAAFFTVFFVYFGGSFGWIVSYFKDKSFGGESLFWSQQSISTLLNHPYAVSILIFLAGLYLFYKITIQKDQMRLLIFPLIILWGSLIEFKAYAGIIVLGTLIIISVIQIFRNNSSFLKISLPIIFLSLVVFLPNNFGGVSLLVISPLWLIHSMVDSADRLNWSRLTLVRMSGFETNNYFKIIGSEIIGLMIFFVGNLGTRIIALLKVKEPLSIKKLLELDLYNLFIMTFLIISLILPLIFIQNGGSFNVIQFFYYFLFVCCFLAGSSLAQIIGRYKSLGKIFAIVVILLTIPTTLDTLRHFLPERPPARVSRAELQALDFLKKQTDGVVLSFYFDRKLKNRFIEPIPLFAYESTLYVGAFSGKLEFISDTVNLNILGIDYKGRLQIQKDVFALKEAEGIKKLLKENQIKYIYSPKISNFSPDETRYSLKKIFTNEEVDIFMNTNI